MNILYQPKGGMCVSCENIKNDCSKLDFASMRVIENSSEIKIVKCSQFTRYKVKNIL